MSFTPTVNAVSVVVEGTLAGQVWALTFKIGKSTAVNATDVLNATTAIKDWFTAEMLPALTNAVNTVQVVGRTMANQTDLPVVLPFLATGAQAVPSLPNNTALIVTKRTNMAGRSGRGRNYIMGLANNSGTSVSPAAGTMTALAQAYADLGPFLSPHNLFDAVVSLFSNNAPRAAGLVNAVTNYSVDDAYDSQRRRLKYRGA